MNIATLILSQALLGTFIVTSPTALVELPAEMAQVHEVSELIAYATQQEQEGNFDFAAAALEKANFPEQSNDLQIRLAENYYRMGPAGHERARGYTEQIIATERSNFRDQALVLRGLVFFGDGDVAAARNDFALAVEWNNQSARAHIGLAACEITLGDLVSAAARMDELGDTAKPYAVEARYLFRVALQRFAHGKPQVTEEMKPALEKIARHAGVAVPTAK